MLSLPLLAPQNEYSFFLSPHLRPPPDTPSTHPSTSENNALQQTRRLASQHHSTPSRQSLAQLLADEHAISSRKHNIRRFGAGWIKPPGVAKTLQAETEEKAEREEQEALQRREQMMMDMQAQQEVEEARNRAAAVEEGEEAEVEGEEERDLDEEIPDADGEEEEEEEDEDEDEDLSGSDEEEDEDEEELQSELQSEMLEHSQLQHSEIPVAEDITFNEDSMFAENSLLEIDEETREQERYDRLQEAELTGVAQDQLDLGVERDLDDSVPEAGSYQHTDSELDDSDEDSDEDEDEEEQEQSQLEEQSEMIGAVMQRSRSSLLSRDVSSLLDSSFVTSSPAPIGRLRSTAHRTGQR
ncbi:hypothetical protein D6C87_04732 [Aureobasidium pullulans]|uniref:Apc15p protein-domain-containing protein n=1 Tax=Aureobasidium pullulans TaxID=5580 RepID=A0AB38LXR1_AURPU|nr:hypothetical protein D6C94_05950 [Aureobasidium pullulans]THZ42834.1 hypothetical protein D6C87_04732 [Aureobasidium pullulans]